MFKKCNFSKILQVQWVEMNWFFFPVGSAVENDDFGDFAAFRTGSPTQNHLSDDTFFTAFQSNTVLQVTYRESYLFPF